MKGFVAPTVVKYGINISSQTGIEVKKDGGSKVLFCADKGIINAGLTKVVIQSLESENIDYVMFDNIVPNPRTSTIDEGVALFKKEKCDYIVAMGGGSVMDSGRVIACIAKYGGVIEDYLEVFRPEFLPLICIPTTHGTGSEVSLVSLVTNSVNKSKMLVRCGASKIALLDPLIAVQLPPSLAAATGIDALSHAIESYCAKDADPMSDALNEKAMELIKDYLMISVGTNWDLEATGNMLMASTMAAQAFNSTGLGMLHAISHSLGGRCDMPHGIANAILLPFTMEYNLISRTKRFAKIAELLGESIEGLSTIDAAYKAIEAVKKLSNLIGNPNTLKGFNVDPSNFQEIAKLAMNDPNAGHNPRKFNETDVIKILEAVYQ